MKVTSSIEKIDEQIEKLKNNGESPNIEKSDKLERTTKVFEILDDTDTKVFDIKENVSKDESKFEKVQISKDNDETIEIIIIVVLIILIIFVSIFCLLLIR